MLALQHAILTIEHSTTCDSRINLNYIFVISIFLLFLRHLPCTQIPSVNILKYNCILIFPYHEALH